jgi:hypothetical protein
MYEWIKALHIIAVIAAVQRVPRDATATPAIAQYRQDPAAVSGLTSQKSVGPTDVRSSAV